MRPAHYLSSALLLCQPFALSLPQWSCCDLEPSHKDMTNDIIADQASWRPGGGPPHRRARSAEKLVDGVTILEPRLRESTVEHATNEYQEPVRRNVEAWLSKAGWKTASGVVSRAARTLRKRWNKWVDKPQILDAAPELTDAAATESAPKKRWVKAFGQWDAADSGPELPSKNNSDADPGSPLDTPPAPLTER